MTKVQDERRDWHGHHVVWCTNHDDESPLHSDDEPYCSKQIHGVELNPEGEVQRATAWIYPTHAFVHGQFTYAEANAQEKLLNGVEIVLSVWRGPDKGWDDEQHIRMTSDAARSLAASLIRAADIEQGLTR